MKIKEGGVMGIQKLTKEQAVIISGFTGILCGEFSDFHADVEKRLGRGVQTFEFGFKEFATEVKKLYEADFIEMGTVNKEQAKAQAVPEGFVLVGKAKIKTWYQDDDEPENFCYEADDFDVLGECLDHEDILRVNKIEDAIIQTTPMYGVWKFKIVGGQPERDCFVLCNTEEEAISIREEYRRMIDLEAQEPAND